MLRVIQQANSAAAKSYYSRSDYYAENEPSPGVWGGKGAAMLGLEGGVGKQDFDRLCDNLDPRTGKMLTARTSHKRTVLYDFNFHVPKGLSLLGEVTQDERLRTALDDSVRETMQEAEADMKARVRKGRANEERTTGNMVWAGFFHHETRPSKEDGLPDPHWHTHVCVFNATFDQKEKQWKAGQFRDLKADAPYYEAAFHARLAKRVADLGYDIRRKGRGGRDWEIANMPDKLVQKFSRRTREIEKLAEELGVTDPKEKDGLGAKSRKAKLKELSAEDLRGYWLSRLTSDDYATIEGVARTAESRKDRERNVADDYAAAYGVKQSFERNSVVAERSVYTEALRFGLGNVTPEGVRKKAKELGLLTRVLDGKRIATTKEVLREEKELLAFARSGRGACKAFAAGPHEFKRQELDDGQRRAVQHILSSPDRVTMLIGKAGVGKTTLLKETVEAIGAAGFKVHAFAPSSEASIGVLRKEGFENATTVAMLLESPKVQESVKDGLIMIDEAGQLGSKTMNKVFKLSKRQNARVLLVGDPKQHKAVERGTPMHLLESDAGVTPAVVWDIKRQSGEYKLAVADLSEGRTLAGIDRLDKLRWIKELPDEIRNQELAKDYVAAFGPGKEILAISPTHAEGGAITQAIRNELRRTKRLEEAEMPVPRLVDARLTEAEKTDAARYEEGNFVEFHQNAPGFKRGERVEVVASGEGVVAVRNSGGDVKQLPLAKAKSFSLYRQEEIGLARGDLVRFTKNGKTRGGGRVHNGTTARLEGIESNGDLRLDNGQRIARDFAHLSHGYCLTSHAAQGKTVDQVFIAQSTMSFAASSPQQAYVSASRAKMQVTIYTDSVDKLREAVAKSRPTMSATELVKASRRQHLLKQRERIRRVGVTLRRFAFASQRSRNLELERAPDHER